MFVELHIIQNVPPSNLNRDDTGSPKDCEFGGFRRGRISSQSLKRAIRFHPLMRSVEGATPSYRTKLIGSQLVARLAERGHPQTDAEGVVKKALAAAGLGKEDDAKTAILLFINEATLDRIAGILNEHFDDLARSKKDIPPELLDQIAEAVAGEVLSPDLALFGRMIALDTKSALGKKNLNIDAACQVAHAVSTHKVAAEMDFFTAVDDLQPEAEVGAGMMGIIDFNSSCFYRYSVVDTRQLTKNLGGDKGLARRTLDAFLRASIESLPSEKQNTFAAHTRPSFALFITRKGQPLSLVNAFEKPVKSKERSGWSVESIRALDAHYGGLHRIYGSGGEVSRVFFTTEGVKLEHLGEPAGGVEECIGRALRAAFDGGD